MKALLLSAGMGTRLRPITDNIPKVMVPIKDKPCLEHHIQNLKKQGITEFAINTHYLPEKIKNYFGDGSKFGVNIKYSYEQEPLGTAGSLNNFREYFDDTFLVIYADVYADFKIKEILNVHKKNNADITILLDRKRNFEGKGVVTSNGELVERFIEKPQEEICGAMINSGFYVIEPKILSKIPNKFYDFGKDLFPKVVDEGKIFCCEHEGYIFDIGTAEDLKKAESWANKLSQQNL